jgi:Integrase core domain
VVIVATCVNPESWAVRDSSRRQYGNIPTQTTLTRTPKYVTGSAVDYDDSAICIQTFGPSPVPSLGGRAYYVTWFDDYSRFTKLTILQSKDQTLEAYKSFAAWAHTQKGVKIKHLRSDRSGEYTSNTFTKFLEEQGTGRRLTTHDAPQHNGVAESLNRRLVERIRAFLVQSGLPKSLWAEAARFVVWLRNRTTTKVLGNMTPYERLTGQKPNLAGVPEWGQRVWVHSDSGMKLDGRASEARWVGYDEDSTHAHRIYWPDTHKISVERNIRFTTQSAQCPCLLHSPPNKQRRRHKARSPHHSHLLPPTVEKK